MHEPDIAALSAIAAEWPVIAAELEVTDAECRLAASPGSPLAVRAHRRAARRLLTTLTGRSTCGIADEGVPASFGTSPTPDIHAVSTAKPATSPATAA